MRGPGMRLGLDVRRLWRCPQCGAERKLPAAVTSVRCSACSNSPFMQIVEPPRRPRPVPKPLNPFITIDPDAPEEGESRTQPAAVIVGEVVVEGAIVQESAAPPESNPAGGSPHKRNDRRHKNRRQRDRHTQPDQPPHSSPSTTPPSDAGSVGNAPGSISAPDASTPTLESTPARPETVSDSGQSPAPPA